MSQYIPLIKQRAARLRLSSISVHLSSLLTEAQGKSPSYDEFLYNLLSYEVKGREEKRLALQLKFARLPLNHEIGRAHV